MQLGYWYCSGGNATGNYQILTPAYYDQNGQFVVSGSAARTPVRLVSPAPIIVNTATGQQGLPLSRVFNVLHSVCANHCFCLVCACSLHCIANWSFDHKVVIQEA